MTNKSKQSGQLTLLDLIPRTCETCGGTILAPTRGGVPRGTCSCPREAERFTDWTAERGRLVKRGDPHDCCMELIALYESIDPEVATVAKQRGGIALYCPQCYARVTFVDGKWQSEGEA